MTHTIMIHGETGAMATRLVEALRTALPESEIFTAWTPAHIAAERSDGLILSVVARSDKLRMEWGRPYREDTAREIEWLTGAERQLPRAWDPEAKLHGPGKGARVVDVEEVARMVVTELHLPPDASLVTTLRETAGVVAEAEASLAEARAVRDAAVRAAMKGGTPVQSVMDASGLSRQRVYQIVNGGSGE